MSICAVVRNLDNIVINIAIAEPTDLCQDDCFFVLLTNEQISICRVGMTWNGTTFVNSDV